MGCMLSQPVELIRVQRRGTGAFRCGVAEMQGWRLSHEDCHEMICDDSFGSFWVLDGHGGDAAANFCASRLAETLARAGPQETLPTDVVIEEGFEQVDGEFKEFVSTDPSKESGSTVVGSLVSKAADGSFSVKLVNCGDSRGIVIRDPTELETSMSDYSVRIPEHFKSDTGGAPSSPAWPLLVESVDHKPDHPVEKTRIESAGGFVSMNDPDPARLDGNLAVSRGVGDFEYKSDSKRRVAEQKVSCVPDIYEISGLKAGSIIVLACDGLWDVFSSAQVGSYVRDQLERDPAADLGEISANLVRQSLVRNSRDNVTVMVIHLTDGSDWAAPSNRHNTSDEMLNFDKMHADLDEDVRRNYQEFLKRCNFPPRPVPCAISQRWFRSMFECPGTGNIYCNKSCQKKGWALQKEKATSAPLVEAAC